MTSRIQVEAFASMMIVSLPLPPLPVVCLRSEECTDSFASGHDLMNRAICNMVIGTDNMGFDSVQIKEKKEKILIDLNDEIASVWDIHLKSECTNNTVAIEKCYEIYCQKFRSFMNCYPGCADLRIKEMSDVGGDTVIVQQAVAHLNARATTFVGEEIVKCKVPLSLSRDYKSLIKMYVTDLYSESRAVCVCG